MAPADAATGRAAPLPRPAGRPARPALQPGPGGARPARRRSRRRRAAAAAGAVDRLADRPRGCRSSAQRNEIRFAPRHLPDDRRASPRSRRPSTRVTGWASRTKEYVHNVARTNKPERLNLWCVARDARGHCGPAPRWPRELRYAGASAHARTPDGVDVRRYHTRRRHGWDIWAKRYAASRRLEPERSRSWSRPGVDMHPTAALQARLVAVLGELRPRGASLPAAWRISFASAAGDLVARPRFFGDADTGRRCPSAAVGRPRRAVAVLAGAGRRRLAGALQPARRHRWQLAPAQAFPPRRGRRPAGRGRPARLVHPDAAAGPLWVFWARQEPGGPPGQTRRTIAYRVKAARPGGLATGRRSPPPEDRGRRTTTAQPSRWRARRRRRAVVEHHTRRRPAVVRNTVDPATLTWGTAEPGRRTVRGARPGRRGTRRHDAGASSAPTRASHRDRGAPAHARRPLRRDRHRRHAAGPPGSRCAARSTTSRPTSYDAGAGRRAHRRRPDRPRHGRRVPHARHRRAGRDPHRDRRAWAEPCPTSCR